MEKIIVTDAIFREPSPTVPYRININEPTMNALYRQFKELKKLPMNYPISNKQRFQFERGIFKLIERGDIVVMYSDWRDDINA